MKNIANKRVCILVAGVLITIIQLTTPLNAMFSSKENVFRDMNSVFDRTFGSNDIFTSPVDFTPLDTFIKNLDAYITKKITVKIIGADKDIATVYAKIKGSLYEIVNGIKVLYRAYAFKPGKTAQDKAAMNKIGKSFEAAGDKVELYLADIKKIRVMLDDKKEALDVLRVLCQQVSKWAYSVGVAFYAFMLEVE